MKDVFCKIIELEKTQVLITKDYDDDWEQTPLLVITFFINGMRMSQKMAYDYGDVRDSNFDEINKEQCEIIVKATEEILK